MGGSSGVLEVNIINNYFVTRPLTPPATSIPFSRGTGTFNLYAAGNYFDNNKNGTLDGSLAPYNSTGYPGLDAGNLKTTPFAYSAANSSMTASQAYTYIITNVGATFAKRNQVDSLIVAEVNSRGTQGRYIYHDMLLINGGLGRVLGGTAPSIPTPMAYPTPGTARGLNKNNAADAVTYSTTKFVGCYFKLVEPSCLS